MNKKLYDNIISYFHDPGRVAHHSMALKRPYAVEEAKAFFKLRKQLGLTGWPEVKP